MLTPSASVGLAAVVGCSAPFCWKGLWQMIQENLRPKSRTSAAKKQQRIGRHHDVKAESVSSGTPSSGSLSESDTDLVPVPPYASRTRRPNRVRQYSRATYQCMNCNCGPEQSPKNKGGEELVDNMGYGRGFTMDEARLYADEHQQRAMARTPQEVLEILQKGNVRFWTGSAARPEKSAFERRALISKQFPSVAVLGCADSRVPVEIVFDMGLGDMFVVRVAGNCLDEASMASLQFAVVHLGVKVLLVLGHEACGAIKAAQNTIQDIEKEPRALAGLLGNLHQGLDLARLGRVQDARARDREAVVANVKCQLTGLERNDTIMSKVSKNELIVLGGMYELSSGIVDFFDEIQVGQAATSPQTSPQTSPRT